MTLCDLGRWGEAAADVVRFLDHAGPAFAGGPPPPGVDDEVGAMLGLICGLPEGAWVQVSVGLGRWTDWLTQQRAAGGN